MRSAEDRTGPSRTLSLLLNGKTGLELRTGSHEALALVVAREIHEGLDEALGQILGFLVPLLRIGVSIARIENIRIDARQRGRNLEIEIRDLLGRSLVDRAVEDRVDDTPRVLDRNTLARTVPARIDEVSQTRSSTELVQGSG